MNYIRFLVLAVLLPVAAIVKVQAQPLVDGDWLAARLNTQDVVVVDLRNRLDGGSAAVYSQGHIPGAVHSDYLKSGWRTTRDGVVGMLPQTAKLEALIGSLGVGNDSHVVLVPAGVSAIDYASATRVYWTLKYLGHDKVSILNGGYALWRKQQRPLATGTVVPRPTQFKARVRDELLASQSDVRQLLDNGGALIDNRPLAQFLGRNKHPKAKRAGAIPTAHNIPQGQFFEPRTGKFASPEQLRRAWEEADANDAESITYCNTGHWASLGWFMSSELLGNKRTRLYDGSMVDWSANDALPMMNTVK